MKNTIQLVKDVASVAVMLAWLGVAIAVEGAGMLVDGARKLLGTDAGAKLG